jgi:Protein of unknown function (DUF4058)
LIKNLFPTDTNYWREAILAVLPDHYDAHIGECVYLVAELPPERKRSYPDIAVTHRSNTDATPVEASGGIATLEPVENALVIVEGPRETHIEIVHRPDQTLIAALELLSPANKENPGRTEYLAKRNKLARQYVHLVELDLLGGGQRLPLRDPLPSGHCFAVVSRADRPPKCEVYAWTVRQPFPSLPIPLKAPDPDLHLDLGRVFTTTLERGGFQRRLRYDVPVPIRLPEADMQWIRETAQATHPLTA